MIPKYYEFTNRTKILSGLMALDNIPFELKRFGTKRPMIITHREAEKHRGLKILLKSIGASELVIGSIFYVDSATSETFKMAYAEFESSNCDSCIVLGGSNVFEVGKALHMHLLQTGREDILLMGSDYARKNREAPLIAVPMANSGADITGQPDVVVLDPRMTMDLEPLEIISWGMDTLCHAIETYTCDYKNPLSDAYAFSAITLVRDNLNRALKCHRDKKARYGLAHAALLSGLAVMNAQTGSAHAVAYGLEEYCRIPRQEAVAIILPHQLEASRTQNDELYGELLLPLAGSEIYADTPFQERGRKTIQILRNMIDDFHDKYGLPRSLSEADVKRTDFDGITVRCLKNRLILTIADKLLESDIRHILNLAF